MSDLAENRRSRQGCDCDKYLKVTQEENPQGEERDSLKASCSSEAGLDSPERLRLPSLAESNRGCRVPR